MYVWILPTVKWKYGLDSHINSTGIIYVKKKINNYSFIYLIFARQLFEALRVGETHLISASARESELWISQVAQL